MSDELTKPKRPRGRPPLPDTLRKGPNLTFRARGGLREKLVEAAGSSGRSIGEEVARRLEQSFDAPALIDALAARLADGITDRAAPVSASAPPTKRLTPCVFCGATGWCTPAGCLWREFRSPFQEAA